MTAADALTRCREKGVELTAEGDRLRYRAPAGALDTELRGELVAFKADLIALVAVCAGCEQGMTPGPLAADGCAWPGCRHKGESP